MAEINLTSLLDVSFVLLISFIMVAPSLKYGLEIDLPSVSQGAPQLATDQNNLATVLVPRPGPAGQEYFLDEKAVTLEGLEQELRARQAAAGGKLSVEVQQDAGATYETFVQVVAAIRRAGIQSVGLPIEAGSVTAPAAGNQGS